MRSERLPHAASGAPPAELLPCGMYSALSGPKLGWLVRWSRTLRGRFVTTSKYVPVLLPPRLVILLILPVQSSAYLSSSRLPLGFKPNRYCPCVTHRMGLPAVDDGSKTRPVSRRLAPPLPLRTTLRTCGAPSATVVLLIANRKMRPSTVPA